MQRQRLQWLLCTLALLLIVLLSVHLTWPSANTLEVRFNKIERGMTVDQVEALLGPARGPPYSSPDGITSRRWNFPGQCVLRVYFDTSGKVVNKEESEGSVRSQTKEITLGDIIKKLLQKVGL